MLGGLALLALAACDTASMPTFENSGSSLASGFGGVGGYLVGKAIDNSDTSKIAGTAIGLVAAQQLYQSAENGNKRKIVEAYEQGKREARVEASNAYWRAVTGANGEEYYAARNGGKDIHYRQIQYDPHVSQGVIYGADYAPEDMVIRGQ